MADANTDSNQTIPASKIYENIQRMVDANSAMLERAARTAGYDAATIAAMSKYAATKGGILQLGAMGIAYKEGDVAGVAKSAAAFAAGVVAGAYGAVGGPEAAFIAAQAASIGVDKTVTAIQKAGYLTDFLEWWDPLGIMYDGRYHAATTWFQRSDPLTLDLDGDGLETVGIDTGRLVYFDHNGDGVKTATGWVGSDDGFLVLDRNGNGTIDSGAELFGDSTVLADGSTAADGFAALAAQDTNGDGVVDANDGGWGELKIWRDLNQNGISEASELQSLDDVGIASLDVGAQSHSQVLADGNRLADLGPSSLAHALSKRIRSIRLVFNRPPLLISNRHGSCARTIIPPPFRDEVGGRSHRRVAAVRHGSGCLGGAHAYFSSNLGDFMTSMVCM